MTTTTAETTSSSTAAETAKVVVVPAASVGVDDSKNRAKIDILPFGVVLTKSELRIDWQHDETTTTPIQDDVLLSSSGTQSPLLGVVGTITMLNNSAMIWMGWGRVSNTNPNTTTTDTTTINTEQDHHHPTQDSNSSSSSNNNNSVIVGSGFPRMGPMVLGMPRIPYRGAFSDGTEGICTQLVGDNLGSASSVEDGVDQSMWMNRMAIRLSQKLVMPVYVSGDLTRTRLLAVMLVTTAGTAGGSNDNNNEAEDMLLGGLDPSLITQRAAALAEREVGRILFTQKQQRGVQDGKRTTTTTTT